MASSVDRLIASTAALNTSRPAIFTRCFLSRSTCFGERLARRRRRECRAAAPACRRIPCSVESMPRPSPVARLTTAAPGAVAEEDRGGPVGVIGDRRQLFGADHQDGVAECRRASGHRRRSSRRASPDRPPRRRRPTRDSAPRSACRSHAADGRRRSGVTVAKMIPSRSLRGHAGALHRLLRRDEREAEQGLGWCRRCGVPECRFVRRSIDPTCRASARNLRWSARPAGTAAPIPAIIGNGRTDRHRAGAASSTAISAAMCALRPLRTECTARRMALLMAFAVDEPWAMIDHAPHAEQRAAAVLRDVEEAEQRLQVGSEQHGGVLLADQAGDQRAHRLVELEHDVADEAVAYDHVELSVLRMRHDDVAPFDVADVADARLRGGAPCGSRARCRRPSRPLRRR